MSLLFAAALVASAAMPVPTCSWDRPGVDPFTGSLVESVDRYTDIPADVRATLKQRMATRQYDDLVTIRRDAIVGREAYGPAIREMHFGAGRICNSVTRTRWAPEHEERGLVYCVSGHCLLVPTVCRNLSRISRLPAATAPTAGAGGAGGPAGAGPVESAGGSTLAPATGAAGPVVPVGSAGTAGSFGEVAAGGGVPFQSALVTALPTGAPTIAWPGFTGGGGLAGGAPPYPTEAALPSVEPAFISDEVLAPLAAVPEASSVAMWLLGVVGLAAVRSRRSKAVSARQAGTSGVDGNGA